MAGGQGETFRAGAVVLKRAPGEEQANWNADLFATLAGPGFRVPRPVAARTGRWVEQGWCAWDYVAAEHAGRNGGRWPETLAACRAFHAALRDVPEPAFIRTADHAWAIADRLAWGELEMEPLPAFADAIHDLTALLRPLERASNQLVHGDFTANVLFAEGEPPCVIDMSPYWRPAGFAEAIVVADAVSWAEADPDIADLCAGTLNFVQLLVRATLRRTWEMDQHARRGKQYSDRERGGYAPARALLGQLMS
jgi:uncharacterized protein (TIGR02569 family)